MSTVTIPDTQYIGVNLHRSSDGSKPLGFLTPGGSNAAAQKRIDTVKRWVGIDSALRYDIKPEDSEKFEIDNPTAVMTRDNSDDVQERFRWKHYEIPKVKDVDYKIYDNVPNEPRLGFRITQAISRGGSWSGGNKVVRIEDPRGFELEISVDNLVKIMSMTTFVSGECQEACVWGRQGSNNILLPETSKPYKEARKVTDYRNKATISLRDVNFGDTVELKKTENFNGLTGKYMGAYYAYSLQPLYKSKEFSETGYQYYPSTKVDYTFIKFHKRYIFEKDGKYFGVSNCKIHKIIETVDTPVVRTDLSSENYEDLSYGRIGTVIALTTNKVSAAEIALTAEFVQTNKVDETNSINYGKASIWAKDPKSNNMMRFKRTYYDPYYHTTNEYESEVERKKLFEGEVTNINMINNTWEVTKVKGEGGKGSFQILKNPSAKAALNVTDYEWYQLALTINGIQYKVPVQTMQS